MEVHTTMLDRPAFLITIDTEGDNLWANPREVTTENARFLPRFQTLCERYDLKPTWLTNWEMVESPVYCEFAQDVLTRDAGEIGMHLHAWNNPPLISLTDDDFACNPFLTQYPEPVMREKIRVLTDRLESAFGVTMRSHRAGRWGFNAAYARMLIESGYRVDCSVTPHVCWKQGYMPGEVDYRGFPEHAYRMDPDAIACESADSPLLELPVTILRRDRGLIERATARALSVHRFGQRIAGRFLPEVRWLRPNGRNGRELIETMQLALADGRGFVEFMLHSSEFMPGGSPRFQTEAQIESLFDDMERLFEAASECCVGMTLCEYEQRVVSKVQSEQRMTAA